MFRIIVYMIVGSSWGIPYPTLPSSKGLKVWSSEMAFSSILGQFCEQFEGFRHPNFWGRQSSMIARSHCYGVIEKINAFLKNVEIIFFNVLAHLTCLLLKSNIFKYFPLIFELYEKSGETGRIHQKSPDQIEGVGISV